MENQALEIASWGKNIYVKIPVTNTKGEFRGALVERFSGAGVQFNVIAVMTVDQVKRVTGRLAVKRYKAKVTVRFLKVKLDEYENLKREGAQLQRAVGKLDPQGQVRNGK